MLGEKLARLAGKPVPAHLPTGDVVHVRPFTVEEYDLMDELEPGPLKPRAYDRLRLFVALRGVPGFETPGATLAEKYDAWKLACDGEVLEGLGEVTRAIRSANATFRHREPRQPPGEPAPPQPDGDWNPTVGSAPLDPRPA